MATHACLTANLPFRRRDPLLGPTLQSLTTEKPHFLDQPLLRRVRLHEGPLRIPHRTDDRRHSLAKLRMALKKRQKSFVTQFRRRHGRASVSRRIANHSPHNVESHAKGRPEIRLRTQASYDALFDGGLPGSLSAAERFAAAWRVAVGAGSEALARHCFAQWRAHGADGELASRRLDAILAHSSRIGVEPCDADPDDLAALADAGLSENEIVTLSQIVGFVAYQARVVFGLALLRAAA